LKSNKYKYRYEFLLITFLMTGNCSARPERTRCHHRLEKPPQPKEAASPARYSGKKGAPTVPDEDAIGRTCSTSTPRSKCFFFVSRRMLLPPPAMTNATALEEPPRHRNNYSLPSSSSSQRHGSRPQRASVSNRCGERDRFAWFRVSPATQQTR
jgi:hypothetical protein